MAVPFFLGSRWRLLLAIALGLLLPLAALASLVASRSQGTLLQEARIHSERVALLAARTVDEHFRTLERLAESYSRRPGLRSAFRADATTRVRSHLAELVREDPTVDRAFVADSDGVELYDYPPVESVIGEDFSYRDWYRGVSGAGRTYTSEVYQRAAPPRHHLVAVATPIRGPEGPLLGYLVIQRTVHELASWLRDLPRQRGSRVRLFGRNGGLAMAEGPEEVPAEVSEAVTERDSSGGAVRTAEEPDPLTGEASLVSRAAVPALAGSVVVSRPLSAVLAPARSLERWTFGLAGVAAVAMTALGFAWLNALRRQHVELVELGERKDNLTQMIVHDIRNPLSVARMLVDSVPEQGSEEAPRARAELDAALQRIHVLVENLLDVTKLEEGQMALRREPTDVSALLAETVASYRDAAGRVGVTLTTEGLAGVRAEVDPAITRRIAENLLINAIKHTPPGGTVRGAVRESDESVRLEVSDTGEGIPAEELPRMFQKFGRVEGQQRATRRDTGLGLLFCRMAAERHGGGIEVQSRVERGSTFRVQLPKA